MKILEGRQLDAAIAERCFNLELCKYRERYAEWSDGKFVLSERIPNYSTDMAAAWQVAEWIRDRADHIWLVWSSDLGNWECSVRITINDESSLLRIYADTPSEAICHAALKLAEQLEMSNTQWRTE